MFCEKCNMPLAICVCNILRAAGLPEDTKLSGLTLTLADGRTATYTPGQEQPEISGEKSADEA